MEKYKWDRFFQQKGPFACFPSLIGITGEKTDWNLQRRCLPQVTAGHRPTPSAAKVGTRRRSARPRRNRRAVLPALPLKSLHCWERAVSVGTRCVSDNQEGRIERRRDRERLEAVTRHAFGHARRVTGAGVAVEASHLPPPPLRRLLNDRLSDPRMKSCNNTQTEILPKSTEDKLALVVLLEVRPIPMQP